MDAITTILKNGLTKPKVLLALAALITCLAVLLTIFGITLAHPHSQARAFFFSIVLAYSALLISQKLGGYAVKESRAGSFDLSA